MKAVKNIYIIGVLAVLAIVGCGRGVDEKNLSHDEVRAINAWVLEKAINQPDSALMMIERLRGGDLAGIDTTGLSVRVNGPLPDYRCDYLRAKVYGQSLEGMWLDSAIIIGERLTPEALGALLAHFENKVMFQGFCWNLNSFDQEGVQLGKLLAKRVLAHETDGALKAFSDLLAI